jgi:hypothetical protein
MGRISVAPRVHALDRKTLSRESVFISARDSCTNSAKSHDTRASIVY